MLTDDNDSNGHIPVDMTLREAAYNLFLGSRSLIWAFEQGLITEDEYDEAEVQFDITQNRLYSILDIDVDEEFARLNET
jgi:hypothetical protein